MKDTELMERESHLLATIQERLPDFAKACGSDVDVVILHQDSFATSYQEREYALLGMAIKYAGLCGKDVQIIGRNRATLSQPNKPQ